MYTYTLLFGIYIKLYTYVIMCSRVRFTLDINNSESKLNYSLNLNLTVTYKFAIFFLNTYIQYLCMHKYIWM